MGKIFDSIEIGNVLPMKYPLLMIDRAELISEVEAVGIRNLTINELFFQGHFPNHPILPGVLQIEAMKQLAQLSITAAFSPAADEDIYIRCIEKVKFRKPNLPGDRMRITSERLELTDREAIFACKTFNASGLTCEAKITLAVRKRIRPMEMPEDYNELDRSDAITLDIAGLMRFMPHRYPFLFCDYVASAEGSRVTSIKNLSGGEEFFQSCPNDFKIMTEALLCEVMAQSGCAAVLARPENEGKLAYFMSIDKAEFFHPVFPGDRLVIEFDLPPANSRFGKGSGIMSANGRKIVDMSLMFAIVAPE